MSLLQHFAEKPAEWLTGAATLMLMVATFFLWRATDVLARAATDDSRLRRIQATADAWMKIRPGLHLPNLTNEADPDIIKEAGKKALPHLRSLEVYAACVNAGVYDLETFNRISGGWFVQHFRWVEPYIELRQQENPRAYKELTTLDMTIRDMRNHR